jgi:type 1 glutamine amidotransferase
MRRSGIAGAALLTLALFVGGAAGAEPPPALPMKRVLFFSKSAYFQHSVVERRGGQPSWAEQVLEEFGRRHGFAFTSTKDGSLITPEYLAQFDALLFFVCGVITSGEPNVDGAPPVSAAGLQAIFDAVAEGKGLMALHSSADAFHTGEAPRGDFFVPPSRYVNHGAAAHPWIKLLGGEFISHGKQQQAALRLASPAFPGLEGIAPSTAFVEEWYALKEFSPDLHVLFVQETAGMDGAEYQRPPFPSSWARKQGRGRVVYSALGHREDVWTAPFFQQLLLAGLNWTSGRVEADVTPNLTQVAPGHADLPPAPSPGR